MVDTEDTNPYATPYATPADFPLLVETGEPKGWYHRQSYLLRSIICWSVVCVISAAPSFFWGIASIAGDQALAMLLGVFSFICLYVAVDMATKDWRGRGAGTAMSTSLKATYIIRIGMSVLFPVALWVDCIVGLLSVSTCTMFFGPIMDDQANFFQTYVITIVQGVYLNLTLSILWVPIIGIVTLVRSAKAK